VECRFGIPVEWRMDLGFLDNEGISWVDLAWYAEVLDVVEGSGREAVQPDAVVGVIDHRNERGD